MPKKSCCCNPRGRHVAVACRYYRSHANFYVKDGQDGRYTGPDGFSVGVTGFQRLFGLTFQNNPEDPYGYEPTLIRGPYKWNVTIKEFDSTRDVILLSLSGGGSSQYEHTESGVPKGGHSSLLQTRIKASLSTEVVVGSGGVEAYYTGGERTAIGNLSQGFSTHTVPGGGGAGGKEGGGGHGGITNGFVGVGSQGGGGGSQTSGGSAGGPNALDGTEYVGGTGGPLSGGGGGGRYSGGGGDNKSGGGGAASKWPSPLDDFEDMKYSEAGSDRGPGGVCNPFIPGLGPRFGLGGGANIVPDPSPQVGPSDPTRFLGFGTDYNPSKDGTSGVVRAIWIDKYCPCNEEESKVLPDKMYICLTDEQYDVIKPELDLDQNPYRVVRFELDGETYIYFGTCVNAYCQDVRLVDGTPTNISKTSIYSSAVQAGSGVAFNDCCTAIIGIPICRIQQPNCFDCNTCYNCLPQFVKAKYCCEDVEEKPNNYWSVYEGYLWACYKTQFWFPFGIKPEDNLSQSGSDIDWFNPFLYNARMGFEKACLPVYSTEQNPPDICNSAGGNDCEPYFGYPHYNLPPACTVEIGTIFDGLHQIAIPKQVQISSVCCGKPTPTPIKSAWDISDCSAGCEEWPNPPCLCGEECMKEEAFTSTWKNWCDSTPIVTGSVGDCESGSTFKNKSFWTVTVTDVTWAMNPIVGMEIIIPKCPPPPDPNQTALDITSVYGLGGFCGRKIVFRPNFAVNMNSIAAALNGNPFGIVYNPINGNVFVTPRYGAKACKYNGIDPDPPPADIQVDITVTETLSTRTLRFFYLPKTYVYTITAFNQCSCAGAGSQICNGHGTLPPLCGCVSPWINSYRTGLQTQTCWFGIYNMAKMSAPIFAKGEITPQQGNLNICKFPQSLLSQLDADPLALAGYGILSEFGGDAVGGSQCDQYDNVCALGDGRPPTQTSICTEQITLNLG